MARMFCSLKQAADRLDKTEEELKEIVRQGRLRGFPDGPNLFLKVDEVEALVIPTAPRLSCLEARYETRQRPTRLELPRLRRLSMWQWLVKGLRQDNAVAVVVFGLLLYVILLLFVVLGCVLYAI